MPTKSTESEPSGLWPALVAALAEMPNVPRLGRGNYGTYAEHATVLGLARPILAAHGLVLVQTCSSPEPGKVTVKTGIVHISGECIGDTLTMPAGATPQTMGSAITYARRYSAMAILGMAGEDDDGQSATDHPYEAPVEQPAADEIIAADVVAAILKGIDRRGLTLMEAEPLIEQATGRIGVTIEQLCYGELAGVKTALDHEEQERRAHQAANPTLPLEG